MAEELKGTIRRLSRATRGKGQPSLVDISPRCSFGAVVDERIKEIERNLGELKSRINGRILIVLSAVVAEVIIRLLG